MRRFLPALAATLLCSSAAFAGTSTITVLDSAGVVKTYAVTTNGATNFIQQMVTCDGTAAAQCAAVKAASTPAAATDPALVVSFAAANSQAGVTQVGTWTVQPGNTANTTPWLVTATITSGTVTANQGGAPWTVNPGTAANWAIQAVNTALGANGALHLGSVTTAAPTYTTGNASPLSLDTAGNLRVNVVAGGGSGGTSSNFGSAFPTLGTAVGFTDGTNMVAGRVTTYGTAPTGFNALAVNAFVTNTNANGQATMANSSPVVLPSDQKMADPCTYQLKTNVPINTTANVQLVAGVAAKKVYVCSLVLVANAAVGVSIVEGSGSVCATSPAAVMGSSTAVAGTNGLQLAAQGGLTLGAGHATVASSVTNANALCLLVSSAVLVSGNLTYIQQ